jgi:hypothetical protein
MPQAHHFAIHSHLWEGSSAPRSFADLTTFYASRYRARAPRLFAQGKEASRYFIDVASTPALRGGNLFTPSRLTPVQKPQGLSQDFCR